MKRTRVGLVCKYVYLKEIEKNFHKGELKKKKGEHITGEMKVNHTFKNDRFGSGFKQNLRALNFLRNPDPMVANPDFKQIQMRF